MTASVELSFPLLPLGNQIGGQITQDVCHHPHRLEDVIESPHLVQKEREGIGLSLQGNRGVVRFKLLAPKEPGGRLEPRASSRRAWAGVR